MKALTHKLTRDLWAMRGQVLAIALVIGAGMATVLMSYGTLDSLKQTRNRYYADYGFAEVFVQLKRAPEKVAEQLAAIPGIARVDTRVVAPVTVDIEGFGDPITGLISALPAAPDSGLNRIYLRAGRYVEPWRSDEVIIGDAFAREHGLQPGDRLAVIINGGRKSLRVVGLALSPEHIYQTAPGTVLPDFKRYAVMWMARDALASAYDMEGAFNDASFMLSPGVGAEGVIEQIDRVLTRYGGLGAYPRDEQISHEFLNNEFNELDQMGSTFSVIFLGVSAFLLNLVIGRLVSTEREQIAALKAFGYSNLQVGWHYAQMVILIVLIGVALGLVGGIWLGQSLAGVYIDYFRFPFLFYELQPWVVVVAVGVTLAAALLGTALAVYRAVRLPPAQAMRPEPPPLYRATVIERIGVQRWLSQPARMILRHIERRPLKSLLTSIGIGMAGGVVIAGTFFNDAVDYMIDINAYTAFREDLSVTFIEPTDYRAIHALARLPGVERVEAFRAVPVRLHVGNRDYRTVLQGYAPGADLHRALDWRNQPIDLPPAGLVLNDYLGRNILDVDVGDEVFVEVQEKDRPTLRVPVVRLVQQYIGSSGYMDLDALNRALGEGRVVSGAYLQVDDAARQRLFNTLKEMPRVAGVQVREYAVQAYYSTIGELIIIFIGFIGMLAAAITFGVVYNSARITLAERSRELASLRVLGFTRGEISYILLGELAVLTLASIPLGFLIGWGLSYRFIETLHQELFRLPLVLEPDTFALASVIVLVSAIVSGLIVRHKLDRLDLIAALKTKE